MSGRDPADEMSIEESRKLCEVGHQDRQELDALLNKPRNVQPLKDFKMKIVLGSGKVKRTSLRELEEEYKTTDEGQLLLNGGSLTVPVVDYVKDKFKLKSVEMLERMEEVRQKMLDSSQLSVERMQTKLERQQLSRIQEREEELRAAFACQLSMMEDAKTAEIEEVKEKVRKKSKMEIETLRSRFKIMQATGGMERSPSVSESEFPCEVSQDI